MKKKAIKIAASTAVAASAFVAAAPAQQADAATNVNQLVTDAQNAGTVLKWAISVEGSANFTTRPYDEFNAAKKAIAAAEAAASKLSSSERLSINAKLVDAKIQVKRAMAYIDAITSSEKIKADSAALDTAIKSNDIEKVETAYHKATGEYRKQAALLDRVYGQTTRDGIRNAVKPAIEKLVASVKNEVTVNMLVKAAAADVKAGKIADATLKLAEAQAIIDANALKWESALQKSADDVTKSLPADNGNITVDTAAFHGEVGQTQAVVANFKTSSGAAYNGPVKIAFTNGKNSAGATVTGSSAYKVVTVNGAPASGDTVYPVNGQLVLTVTTTANAPANAVAGGKVEFVTYPNGVSGSAADVKYSGTMNFYNKFTGTNHVLNTTNGTVKYADAANNYFVTTDLNKYVLPTSGNVYQDTNNAVITLDAFKAKLTAGDVVTGEYNYGSGSTLKLALDYQAQAEFTLDQVDKLVSGTSAYRVEGNTVTLSGKGDAGKVVSIYNANIGGNPIAQVQVASNGLWSVNVAVPVDTTFVARQATSVNDVAPAYSASLSTVDNTLRVAPGKFITTPAAGTVTSDNSLTGDTFAFNATNPLDATNTALVTSSAQVTLLDGDLTKATFVNGVNGTVITKTASGFQVKFGAPSTISGGNGVLNGSLTVNDVTGVTNAYELKANVTGSITSY
ncbi:hypothetical protein [Bacillus sp. Cr_A10]|uniref:hypothetical protein n=1 Tax=Bacillus sp. Cr_A10 TaxID=3033993 RepID=UPI0023DC8B2F|nr:hypothetical protein [Bacillus sp. Cr_A10]MDF2068158.1 hypothetical protein [Bacillus sp. Cr_A10]